MNTYIFNISRNRTIKLKRAATISMYRISKEFYLLLSKKIQKKSKSIKKPLMKDLSKGVQFSSSLVISPRIGYVLPCIYSKV